MSATKITNAPAAFSAIAGAINNHADLIKPLKAGKGIQIAEDGDKTLVSSFITQSDIDNVIIPRIPFPFKIVAVEGSAKVTVVYGTVTGGGANIVPTIGGTSLADPTPPELTVVTGTVYLKATVDSAGTPTAVIIDNAASTPTDTSTLKYRTIGNVTVSGSTVTISQSVRTSLTLFICNGTAVWEVA